MSGFVVEGGNPDSLTSSGGKMDLFLFLMRQPLFFGNNIKRFIIAYNYCDKHFHMKT